MTTTPEASLTQAQQGELAQASAELFLRGAQRSREELQIWSETEAAFGGIAGLIRFWSEHEGVAAELAEATSALLHAQAAYRQLPEQAQRLVEDGFTALWVDGDLDRATALVAELGRVAESGRAAESGRVAELEAAAGTTGEAT